MKYLFVISSNEDGEVTVEQLGEEEFIERINDEEYYGEVNFLDKISQIDPNYWGNKLLVIRGEIVIPKPVEKITKYEIE